MDKTKQIELIKPHRHAGRDYLAGQTLRGEHLDYRTHHRPCYRRRLGSVHRARRLGAGGT